MIIRFADDSVCAFEHKQDAVRFYEEFGARLSKFGLEVAADKTRILRFSRFDLQGSGRFEFLGFEFRWAEGRQGGRYVKRRTARKKHQVSVANFTAGSNGIATRSHGGCFGPCRTSIVDTGTTRG